jgi:hypothetical protein
VPRRICSRHYPFSHRFFGLNYIWNLTLPTLSDFGTPTTLPTQVGSVALTKLTDIIRPGAPLVGSTWGGTRNALATYSLSVTTPGTFPAGWSISSFNTLQIEIWYFRRTRVLFPSSITEPQTRSQRRAYTDAFYIAGRATLGGRIRAQSGFLNFYDINVEGRWGVDVNISEGPASMSDYVTAPVAPTIIECTDTCGYNDHTTNFTGTDWTLETDTTFAVGTVPAAVSTYMDALKDSIKADLAAATMDVTWRTAALAGSVPSGVTNRSLLVNNTIPQVAF